MTLGHTSDEMDTGVESGREAAKSKPTPHDVEVERERVSHAIRRIVAADPDGARRLLAALHEDDAVHLRRPVLDAARSLGFLSGLMAEAVHPTPLRLNPGRLSEAWAAVGGYIQRGMRKVDERLEHHG